MRAGEYLTAAGRLPLTTDLDRLLGPGGALVLAPHPDDESIGCGGLIAAATAAGRDVEVVVLSDGTGSHPNSAAYPPPRLQALREAETRAAALALGLAPAWLHFLGLPDRAVPAAGPRLQAAAAAILRAIAGRPQPTAILATWAHDPHADHQACAALAAALATALPTARRLEYPVWGWAFAAPIPGFDLGPEPRLPGPPRGLRLDIAAHLPAKRRAIAAHASQVSDLIADDPAGFRLPPEALALADRPFELYLEPAP